MGGMRLHPGSSADQEPTACWVMLQFTVLGDGVVCHAQLKGAEFAQAQHPQGARGAVLGVHGCWLRPFEVRGASAGEYPLLPSTRPPRRRQTPRLHVRVRSPNPQGSSQCPGAAAASRGRGCPGLPDPRGGRCCLADPSLAPRPRPSPLLPPRPPFVRRAARPRAEAAGRGTGGAAWGAGRAGRSRGPGLSRTGSPRRRSPNRRQPGSGLAPRARRGGGGGHRAEPEPESRCLEEIGPRAASTK